MEYVDNFVLMLWITLPKMRKKSFGSLFFDGPGVSKNDWRICGAKRHFMRAKRISSIKAPIDSGQVFCKENAEWN